MDRNPQDGQPTPEQPDNPPRSRPRKNIPTSNLGLASLGLNVANAWPQFFPNLQVPDTDPQQLRADAATLSNALGLQSSVKNDRKQNRSNLLLLHKNTNEAVSVLKNSIKAAHPKQDLAAIYPLYGLKNRSRGIYSLPTDNDDRAAAMGVLVAKLQERGNPVAAILHPDYNLAKWQQWQSEQQQVWLSAINYNEQSSQSSDDIALLRPKVQTALSKILQYLGGLYSGAELRRKKRTMGFLRETY